MFLTETLSSTLVRLAWIDAYDPMGLYFFTYTFWRMIDRERDLFELDNGLIQ